MRKDRLLKLADFLETVPRRKFNISSWQTKAPTRPEGKAPGSCGFAGCAVGWAAHQKMFRGLKMGKSEEPEYMNLVGWSAVIKLFDLARDWSVFGSQDAELLFDGSSYPNWNPTPKQVAKRIRKFVQAP